MLQLSANYAIVLMGKAREATYPQKIGNITSYEVSRHYWA